MVKGTLVQVRFGSREFLGSVIDYRPEVLGGSHIQSWREREGGWFMETVLTPKRGEVLVLFYDDGDFSWVDEHRVQTLKEQ
jgi:hypothetical protein